MKFKIFILIFFSLFTVESIARGDAYPSGRISKQRFIKIMPFYQSWDLGNSHELSGLILPKEISELSLPLFVYFPVNRQLSFSLRGCGGNSQAGSAKLSGLADTQLMVNYHLEATNLIVNLGLNIPNGKNELSATEFNVSRSLSYNYFNFQTPNFGQGLNISPGLTWAHLIKENVAVGLGASYQYKGKFKPLKYMLDDYDPGDEILLTAGVDFRLNEISTLSADVIFVTYATDKRGNKRVFASGNSFVLNLQYRRYFQHNELWLLARYRTKTKNSYVIGGVFQQESEKSTPEQLEGMGHYRMRINPQFNLAILGEVRSYYPNDFFSGVDIFGLGVAPEYYYSPSLKIPLKINYYFGDFPGGPTITGWELGIGCEFFF